ncbi:MAG: hypothetical protein A2Y40_00370 [Candidatus Margulisbacteria bacterium GWF2_35_9]|nr:MAG: hypothetical protein A2Y40_00370 [Candidatus Margulisbacteria bacterium GWF2_35_9]
MLNKLLDIFFPRKCVVCNENSINRICPSCELKKVSPTLFNNNLYYLYKYDGAVRKILHRFKFMQDKALAKRYLKPMLELDIYKQYDLIIPVPCHWLRVLKRKFNHLNFLFDGISIIDYTVVKRQKHTKKLYKLTKKDRQKMIHGVFKLIHPEKTRGKRILIVDDIYTTGTSFNEIQKLLLPHAPSCVDGFFICRA